MARLFVGREIRLNDNLDFLQEIVIARMALTRLGENCYNCNMQQTLGRFPLEKMVICEITRRRLKAPHMWADGIARSSRETLYDDLSIDFDSAIAFDREIYYDFIPVENITDYAPLDSRVSCKTFDGKKEQNGKSI